MDPAAAVTTDPTSTLRDLLATVADEQTFPPDRDVTVDPLTSGGGNYTSELYLATISAPGHNDLNLFAKVAIIGEEMRKQLNADRYFECERFVYTELVKAYDSLQDEHNITGVDRLVFPKFYGYRGTFRQETIVLENLVASGYSAFDRLTTFDWEYAAAAVRELAKWHALSFAYQEREPERFEQIMEERKFEMPKLQEDSPWLKGLAVTMQALSEEQRAKLQVFLQTIGDSHVYHKPRGKPVLAHGDYRPSNLMSRLQDGRLQIVPLDYQTVHTGAPPTDLLYFIFSGSDKAFRDKYYNQLVDHYYSELELAMRRLDLDPQIVYSREQFDKEYALSVKFGLIVGLFVLPVIVVEEENAPQFNVALDDMVAPKPNQIYLERITGIVDNYVEWGLI